MAAALATAAFAALAWRQWTLSDARRAARCDGLDGVRDEALCGIRARLCRDPPGEVPPRPLVVVAAGASRSASTFLYNALRILMRIRDPNTIYGWHEDLQALHGKYGRLAEGNTTYGDAAAVNRLEAFKSVSSVLVKVHLVQDWHDFVGLEDGDTRMEPYVDAVFTTHRDPRTVVRSIRDMGWGVKVDPKRLSHPDFCKKRHLKTAPVFLTAGEFKRNPSVWVNMAKAHIICRHAMLESAGSKHKMDLRAEDLRFLSFEQKLQIVREISQHLEYAYTNTQLSDATRELQLLRPVPCSSGYGAILEVNPTTHLHRGHIFQKSDVAAAMDAAGMEAISKDPFCAKWLRDNRCPA